GSSLYLRVGGGSGVGWFPLAPGEVYVPGYRVSDAYVRRVNVTNVNITNIRITNIDVTRVRYKNRDVANGVTVVTRETFAGARPVDRNVVVVTRERASAAPVVGTTAPVAPTRESVLIRRGPGGGPARACPRRDRRRRPRSAAGVAGSARRPHLRTNASDPPRSSVVLRPPSGQPPSSVKPHRLLSDRRPSSARRPASANGRNHARR